MYLAFHHCGCSLHFLFPYNVVVRTGHSIPDTMQLRAEIITSRDFNTIRLLMQPRLHKFLQLQHTGGTCLISLNPTAKPSTSYCVPVHLGFFSTKANSSVSHH